MELRITLAPDGGLRLLLPTRSLDVGLGPSALHFIQRILRDAASGKRDQRGYISEFPTQHVIDIWRAQDLAAKGEAQLRATLAREEAAAERAAAKKAEFKELGIDLDVLDIRL